MQVLQQLTKKLDAGSSWERKMQGRKSSKESFLVGVLSRREN
jgi:hypothetical protein